jgi:hypothetical protein
MNPMPEYQPIEPLEPMNNNPSGKSRMRSFIPAFIVFMVAVLGLRCEGQVSPSVTGTPHYAVSLSIVVGTEAITGTTASSHSVAWNNGSMLKALVLSGSSQGLTAGEMDIVVNESNLEMDVINRNTNAVVSILSSGTLSSLGGSIVQTNRSESVTSAVFGNTLSLPGVSGTDRLFEEAHFTFVRPSYALTKLTMTLVGGSGSEANGSNFVQGTIRKRTGVYYY